MKVTLPPIAVRLIRMTMIIVAVAALAGCTTSEPAPAPPPSPFDRAWNAALGAAQDEGVRITSADRATGMIAGYRDRQEVRINLQTQADGNVKVEMSARGPKGSDPGLAGRISRAYDRRMGR
jgi:hypothetical protein